ncbi:MAG: alpha-hydroxy-acid oxidizing protein [Candidatus Micrarchaeia archaeon]
MSIISRKEDHLSICLSGKATNTRKTAGFEDIKLIYDALPELDINEINTSCIFLGKRMSAPFYIDAMTGGSKRGEKINKELAAAAERAGIGFALGSQRAMIEKPELTYTYKVRDVAPTIPIIGNIGAANLREPGMIQKTIDAVKTVDADALAVHLNPMHEIVQPEGEKDFRGTYSAIQEICDAIDVPVIAKEVGCGISGKVARKLDKAGIDMIRSGNKMFDRFADSGMPTVVALASTLRATKKPVIVSGGVRGGVDIAKSLAMGACAAAAALPFLLAWKEGKLNETIKRWKEELKTTMLLTGSRDIHALKRQEVYIVGRTADFLESAGLL